MVDLMIMIHDLIAPAKDTIYAIGIPAGIIMFFMVAYWGID